MALVSSKPTEKYFQMPALRYNLNFDPLVVRLQSVSERETVSCALCCCGQIACTTEIPKMGYAVGERLRIRADIVNQSRATIGRVSTL